MTRQRSGMTLIEVLVAIFIMAIGLIALLTLFPIGMLRLAMALRDERICVSVQNAHAISIMQDIRNDPLVISDGFNPDFFKNPLPGTLLDANPYGESYPILVDPIGYKASPTPDWVGGPGLAGYLRRRPVGFTLNIDVNILKNFTLWDDINFDGTLVPGTPQKVGNVVLRDSRYSWAYLLRRPQTIDRSIVDGAVVVMDQRALTLTGSLALEEYVYPVTTFNPTNSTITIDHSAAAAVPPPLRPGDWILDATAYQRTINGVVYGSANGYFYRVVASDDLGGNVTRYEVAEPHRGYPASITPAGGTYMGTAIVIRGIAAVIDKGPVRLP